MATKKLKLKDKKSGAFIEVTPSAYQMRRSKYDKTHTVVQEAKEIKLPPVAPVEEPEQSNSELDAHDEHVEEPAVKERKKPGPKPKNQEAE